VLARVRSTRDPSPARLVLSTAPECELRRRPEEGVAPGQACVLYARSAHDPEPRARRRLHRLNKVAAADGSRYAGQGKQWWVKTFPDREEGTLASFVGTEQVASQVLARCVKRPAGATAPVATAATATAAICASGDLSLARVSEDAGAGQRQVVYSLKNNGRSACVLKGYPTLELIDANGADAPVKLVQTEAAFISLGGPPQDVTLAANGQAVFFIGFTGIQATDKPCVAVSRLRAIPPGNSQAIEIEDSIQPCTGEVKVTPVRQDTGVGMSKAFY
jgi:hypothetical protein